MDPIKVEYQDPASGKSYTYNKRTGSTRWTPEAMQKTLSSPPKLEGEELTTGENEVDKIDGTPEELPTSGKVEYQDPASGQTYLYNTRTGSTRWSTEEVGQKTLSSLPKVEEER